MKKTPQILFREEDHKYLHQGKPFTGANGLLSKYGFDFDRDYYSVRKAFSNNIENFWKVFFAKGFTFDRPPTKNELIEIFLPRLEEKELSLGEEVAKVLDSWELSAIKGTEFHKQQEDWAHFEGHIVNPYDGKEYKTQPMPVPPEGYQNCSIVEHLSQLEDGAYTEAVVFSLLHEIAGQVDELFIESKRKYRYVDIGDHKTNSTCPKLDKGSPKLKYPLWHLPDCTYVKYQLQVSLYAYLLQLAGFKVRNIGFYHYEDYNPSTKKVITFKYLEKECKSLLDLHLNFGIN